MWQRLPARWQNSSARWQSFPARWQNLPARWQNLPARWQRLSAMWQNFPARWGNYLPGTLFSLFLKKDSWQKRGIRLYLGTEVLMSDVFTLSEAKSKLSEIVNRIIYKKDKITITKKGSATPTACTAWPFSHVKDVFSNLCFFCAFLQDIITAL